MIKTSITKGEIMISRVNEIGYPEIIFWKKKVPQITFINRRDFRKDRLLKILGLSKSSLTKSFGVTDREEILRRQRILKLLVQNPSLAKFFMKHRFGFFLPTEGQAFLNYFRPDRKHNPFWSLMTTFIRKVSRCKDIPSEIASLVSFLKRTGPELEQEETAMARKIGERLQKATYFEGVACFKVDDYGQTSFSEKDSSIYGFKKYSYSLSRILPEIKAPGRAGHVVLEKAIELTQTIISWVNGRIFYRPLKIRHIPIVTIIEIGSFLNAKLMDSLKEFCDRGHGLILKVLFRFSVDGLEIQLIGVERKESKKKKEEEYKIKQSFSGYTWRDHLRIRKINEKVLERIRRTEEQLFLNRIVVVIEKVIPDILKSFVRIESPNTDLAYKWDAVPIMYRKEFKGVYRRVSKYHNYLFDHFCILREIAEVAKALKNCSKKWRKPLCFPKILDDDKHMVSFKSLEPIHLINQEIGSKK